MAVANAVDMLTDFNRQLSKPNMTFNSDYAPTFEENRENMQKLLKQKVTKSERDWILYDVGNSGYSLMLATILPIYFNHLA